jgi:hypothetical protein
MAELRTVALSPPVEVLRFFTLLGIRFWDAHTEQPVQSQLSVMAQTANGAEPPTVAVRSKSNAYVFQHLPGMRRYEMLADDTLPSPPHTPASFVITVEDTEGVFLPAAFTVELPLPYRGEFLSDVAGARAYLFSQPSRPVPIGMTAIRADLFDADNGREAAFGVLRVTVQGTERIGIADERGRTLILLPWPTADRLSIGSPPGSQQGPVFDESWAAEVRVAYDDRKQRFPLAQRPSAPDRLKTTPSLKSVLDEQPAALIHSVSGDAGLAMLPDSSHYGAELVLKTSVAEFVRLEISRGNP